jgi:hypothetical protein
MVLNPESYAQKSSTLSLGLFHINLLTAYSQMWLIAQQLHYLQQLLFQVVCSADQPLIAYRPLGNLQTLQRIAKVLFFNDKLFSID